MEPMSPSLYRNAWPKTARVVSTALWPKPSNAAVAYHAEIASSAKQIV
jgi:hypothetical protein